MVLKVIFRRKIAALVVIALILGIGIGSFIVYSDFIKSENSIKIGYLRGDLHQLSFFVASERELYKEEGLDIAPSFFSNGVEEMDAFTSGSIDIGYLGIAPAILKRINAETNIKIIAAVNYDGSAIIAPVYSSLYSISDLKGKTIAIPGYGTVQNILLNMALEQSGININEVNMTQIGPWNMQVTLEHRDVDAFIAWEPYPAKAVEEGSGKYLVKSSEIWKNHPCCVLAVQEDFLRDHRDIVEKIVKIHINATNWIKANPSEAASIGAQWTGVDQEVVVLAMKNIEYNYYPDKKSMKIYLEKLIQYGYVDSTQVEDVDLFMDSFIDTSIIEQL
ncbi:MAG: ABC transporter substrate-binding protein [Promethearchaeota archaeon]